MQWTEAATRGVLWEKVFLEISQNSQKNTCARVSFLIKLQALGTLAQVFSCEFCEISKNTFFTEYVWTTASEWKLQGFSWRLDSHICYSYILLINTPDINSWYTNPPPYFQRNRFFSLSWIKVMKTSNLIF